MYCTECGANNTKDSKYCKQCGKKLAIDNEQPSADDQFDFLENPEQRIKDLLLLAFKQSEREELDKAIHTCSEALHYNPDSSDALSLISTLYERKGDTEQAIKHRERVLELNPGSIADREKLDQLKDKDLKITPKKIISLHKQTTKLFLDSPGAFALLAVSVTLFILMIGAGVVLWHSTHKPASSTTSYVSNYQQPSNPAVASNTTQTTNPYASQQEAQNGVTQQMQPSYPPAGYYTNSWQYPSFTQTYRPQVQTQMQNPYIPQSPAPRALAPLPLVGGGTPLIEKQPTSSPKTSNQGSTTIHLPDASNTGGDTSASNNATTAQPTQNNSGQIDIQVLPDNGGPNSPTTTNTSSSSGSSSGMDSQASLKIAQDLQMQGQYRQAIRNYIKALDGAGNLGGIIQQQMALCYFRLGEKDKAISHYQDAISIYKSQLSAGKNVDAAQSGINTCQAGIQACK